MENVELNRTDILTVSSTNRNCCRTLPQRTAGRQKILVGDSTGTLQSFHLGKNGTDVMSVYKINLNQAPGQTGEKKPITSVDVSGESVFVACGEVISGVKKKGGIFFRLDLNMNGVISAMKAQTPFLWTAAKDVLTAFENGQEQYYFKSPAEITHLVVESLSGEKTNDVVLACVDNKIRIVAPSRDGPSGGPQVEEYAVEGSVMTVQIYSTKMSPHKDILYGTDNGFLGAWRVGQPLVKRWDLSKLENRSTAGYTAIHCHDFTGDGQTDLLVGRDNGDLEIYSFSTQTEPALVLRTALNEKITALDVGKVVNLERDDIVISTFSGKVLAFSAVKQDPAQLPVAQSPGTAAAERVAQSRKKNEKKIEGLKSEIEKLKERLVKKKEEYSKVSEDLIPTSAESQYKVQDKFVLEGSKAYWVLTLEMECPIESIALVCDVDVELMDIEGNNAIVSRSTADGNIKMLAVYRNTDNSHRLEVKVRTTEGQYGKLQAFVIPALVPKTAQMCSYDIKPLSLHQRLTEKPAGVDDLLVSTVTITGSFGLPEINAWVGRCLPEVPTKASGDDVTYYFRSTFQGTVLVCKFKAGEAVFKSNNVSTLSLVRKYVSESATEANTQVKTTQDIKDETYGIVLDLLHEKMQYQVQLSERIKLIGALQEIEMQEQDVSFIAPEYKEVLQRAKTIEKEFELQPRRLEFLTGIIKTLYEDKCKFKGQGIAKDKATALNQLLEKYDIVKLKEFFMH